MKHSKTTETVVLKGYRHIPQSHVGLEKMTGKKNIENIVNMHKFYRKPYPGACSAGLSKRYGANRSQARAVLESNMSLIKVRRRLPGASVSPSFPPDVAPGVSNTSSSLRMETQHGGYQRHRKHPRPRYSCL